MNTLGIVAIIVAVAGVSILATLLSSTLRKARELQVTLARHQHENAELTRRLKSILDVEAEARALRTALAAERAAADAERRKIADDSSQLSTRYSQALATYQSLSAQVQKLEENLEDISFGLYEPHFTYADSDAYKAAIIKVREREKAMIKAGTAASCSTTWTVGGSDKEGARMVKQYEKLVLRAFNAESESAIANVTWSNYRVMRERLQDAFDALNKLGAVMHISLSEVYKNERLDELRLVFESVEKSHQEHEAEMHNRAEQREEERVQRELAREKEDAEQDESRYQKALDRARKELEQAHESEHAAMLTRIQELETNLATARNRKDRAIAQAQLTKAGHVYVISNVGAFGEGVLKIGHTRRLDPEDRVHELGGASVPFPFDTHAMVYSENAPELEAKLHNHFWERRLNWANDRKEFFRVSLDDMTAEMTVLGLKAEVLTIPEAKEYRQTLLALEAAKAASGTTRTASRSDAFPSDAFGPAVQSPQQDLTPAESETEE